MGNKKTYIFPSLLFVIFFLLITVTGIVQLRVIQKSIEELLTNEAEIITKHIRREIDVNLEYLNLLDISPSIITPNFLNILAYDEDIVEGIYASFKTASIDEIQKIPISNIVVLDNKGEVVLKKGAVQIRQAYLKRLMSGEEVFVKTPEGKDKSLLMGFRVKERFVFFLLNDDELEALRTRHIVKEVLNSEEKRLNIAGINIYDEKKRQYASSPEGDDSASRFALYKPLESKFLKGFHIEVLLSKDLAKDILHRTTINFVFILVFLVISGALSTYIIFYLERRYSERVRAMEKELALKERLVSLGRLSSGMAHEIRNPLNAVSMSVQRLKREFVPEKGKKDEYDRFIDIMRSELSRINRIVEEFLLSAKSHAPFQNENLYAIVDEICVIIKEKANANGVELVNDIDRKIFLETQKERLKQAFYNIILNGIESIDNGGYIKVSSRTAGGMIEISISDTGHGIKEDEKNKIFEYYYTSKDKGMGLGLPISYMIIRDHGGDMKVESEPGKGTTFRLTVPARQK
jgi:signal transduction histidine kinase